MSGNGTSERFKGPLFIVGMPRSGTKLLREILNRHERIRIPDTETEFLPYLASQWQQLGNLKDRKQFHALYRRAMQFPFFRYRRAQGRDIDEDEWYRACTSFTVASVFEALIRVDAGLGEQQDGIWGDKSPSYVRHIHLLQRLYPQGKIVHIIRDVRDYCRSMQRAWGKNPVRAACRWNDALLRTATATRDLAECYVEVRYERLLEDPETEMERLCAFIGIGFDSDMLNVSSGTENLGDAKGVNKIVSSNKGKFSTAFDEKTLLAIEQAALPAMQAFGYQAVRAKIHRPPSAIRLRLYQVRDGLNLIRADHPGKGLLGGALFHLAYKRITRSRS